jgi:hypothetical protein
LIFLCRKAQVVIESPIKPGIFALVILQTILLRKKKKKTSQVFDNIVNINDYICFEPWILLIMGLPSLNSDSVQDSDITI